MKRGAVSISRGGPPAVVNKIYNALLREARKVSREDWTKHMLSNDERDRYAQGMRDAATLALQTWDRSRNKARG